MRRPELMFFDPGFDAWAADAIARRDVDALVDFKVKGPGTAIAHPTDDHFVPLLLTLGAADDESETPRSVIARETMWNSIRSIQAA